MSDASLASIIKAIQAQVPYEVDVGVICGSGLSNLSAQIQNPIVIEYASLPNFPHSAVMGHKNEMIFGDLGSKKVICLRGRFHFYEGWSPKDTVLGVKVMAALGCKTIVVTNAAGGLDKSFKVGDVMLIEDHISFIGMAGNNCLVGSNDESVGPRFPSVSSAYDAKLGEVFAEIHAEKQAETGHEHEMRRGCYVGLSGPNYESRHEIEMLRTIGGSAVGMSTVNEVVQASHCGIKVLGLTLITNACLGTRSDEYNLPEPNHQEVVDEIKKVESFVLDVVSTFIDRVDLESYPVAKMASNYSREALANVDAPVAAADASSTAVATKACPSSGCYISKIMACPFVKYQLASVVAGFAGAYLFDLLKKKY